MARSSKADMKGETVNGMGRRASTKEITRAAKKKLGPTEVVTVKANKVMGPRKR